MSSTFGGSGRNGGLVAIRLNMQLLYVLHPRASTKGARVQIEGRAKNKMWSEAKGYFAEKIDADGVDDCHIHVTCIT